MKKIYFAVFFVIFLSWNTKAQCIDAIVTTSGDTIFGMVLSVTDTSYTIDSYNFVISLRNDMVKDYIKCFRQATREDMARMKQLDYLTEKDLLKYTPGYYLRKASRNFYLGLSLDLAGGIAMGVSLASYKDASKSTQKWIVFSAGTVAVAGGIFFLLRSFYLIDKTGKLLDMERSSIYLEPTQDGKIGVIWKF